MIALGIVTVSVLCVIQYFLACNNNNGDIYNGRVRGEGKQRRLKKKGKRTKQSKNQPNKQK
jgi:hypothetical protein